MALSEELSIYKSANRLLNLLIPVAKDLPKFFRYGMGTRMVDLNLDLLSLIYEANMSAEKEPALRQLLIRQRMLVTLLRVCYEQKTISAGRHAEMVVLLDDIGRQATAWKNYLSKRSSPPTTTAGS